METGCNACAAKRLPCACKHPQCVTDWCRRARHECASGTQPPHSDVARRTAAHTREHPFIFRREFVCPGALQSSLIFLLTLSQGLRRAYFDLITRYGNLSLAFASFCKCDFESSQDQRLSLHLFAELLSRHFPQGVFDVAVHNLVWASSAAEGVALPLFVSVMSRAPLLLPHQSCHTMRCILSLCKSNAISCNELFLQFSACNDGFVRRSLYAIARMPVTVARFALCSRSAPVLQVRRALL